MTLPGNHSHLPRRNRSRGSLVTVRSLLLALLVSCALATIGRAASAQTLQLPAPRQGFYISLGGGLAGLGTSDKGHHQGPWGGSTYVFRVGEMLTDRWGLGLAIETGAAKHDGVSADLGGLTLEGQARLWRHLAWHVGAGFGVATVDDPARVDDETHGSYGSLLTTSLSYDAFFTHRATGGWAATPSIGLRLLPGDDVDALAGFTALSITWWSGLPARELREPGPSTAPAP